MHIKSHLIIYLHSQRSSTWSFSSQLHRKQLFRKKNTFQWLMQVIHVKSLKKLSAKLTPNLNAAVKQELPPLLQATFLSEKLRENLPDVRLNTAKTLYQHYLRRISNFCATFLNTFSKEIISNNTRWRKQTLKHYFKNECEGFIRIPNARMVLLFSSVWKPDEAQSTSFWNYFSNKENLFKLSFE